MMQVLGMLIAAETTVGIAAISLAFILGGYLLLGVLRYLMVRRPSRQERRAREAQSNRPSHRQPEDAPRTSDPDQDDA